MRRSIALMTAAVGAAALAAPAASVPSMLIGIYDDGQTLYNGDTSFPVLQQLRTQAVRMQLRWGGPGGVALRRPAKAADPADPAYDWTLYDRAVIRANAAGIKVVFSIYGTPRWENSSAGYNRVPRAAADLRNFAYAAAKRYSGTYTRADGTVLPAVRYWLAWNEPNNPVFLKPQFRKVRGAWVSQGAIDYAKICEAVYTGVHLTTLRDEKVGCGVTAPRGNNAPQSVRPSTSPIVFLRAVKKAGLKRFDAWAHHPYYGSKLETPGSPPPQGASTAITLGNLNTLIAELTRLYGKKRFWITEYGYQTNPPDTLFGVSWAKQATYLIQAFAIARKHARIDMMLWYLLQDEPALGGWQSGLLTTDGQRKPAFTAYEQLPR